MQNYYTGTLFNLTVYRDADGLWEETYRAQVGDRLIMAEKDLTPRKVVQLVRELGMIDDKSKSRIKVVESSSVVQRTFTLTDKGNGRPLCELKFNHTGRGL